MALTLLLGSCGSEQGSTTVVVAGSDQVAPIAKRMSLEGWESNLKDRPGLILDVRTPGEVKAGKIPNAVNVDFLGEDFMKGIEGFDKAKPVHVYCAAGGRSKQAMNVLHDQGFKEVYDLKGGFNAWSGARKPIEQP